MGAVAIGLLLVALAVPALAQHEVTLLTAQNTAVQAAPEKPPGRAHEAGVRALPLAPPGGLVARDFPDGRGLDDTERVRAAIDELLPQLGLQAVMSRLLKVMPKYDEDGGYPYTYAPHDSVIRRALLPGLSAAERRAAVDLATLTVVLAAHDAPSHAAMIGYSLLMAVRKTGNTCDVQTSIAYLVAIGTTPDLDNVRQEVQAAEQLCPDDPTPSWLWAKFLSTQAAVTGEIRRLTGRPAERRRMAERAFADLRTRYPGLPVGYAGTADLYLDWADSAERAGGEPFQVRSWRRHAAELYAQARQRSDDPRLAVGHARALSVLQQGDAAIDLINQAATQDPGDPAIGAVRSTILGRAGRHAEAAAAIAAETTRPPWWSSATSPFESDYLSGGYASAEYPPLTVLDQTPTGYGAGGVDDISFIPRTRYPRSGAACRSLVAMEEWLLAGQPNRVHQLIAALSGESMPEDCRDLLYSSDSAATMTAFADLASGSWSDFESVAARIAGPGGDPAGTESDLQDAWQDLLRSAGQFEAARTAALAWTQREPENGRATQRLGETSYFSGHYDDAVDHFARAATMFSRQSTMDPDAADDFGVYPAQQAVWVRLQQAVALQRLDRDDKAEPLLREAAGAAAQIRIEYSYWTDYVAMHVQSQLGVLAARHQDWPAAADHLHKAISIGERNEEILDFGDDPITTEHLGQAGMLHGAQDNNLALAYVKLGRAKEAVPVARKALLRDPASPVFIDTVAFALDAAGQTTEAVSHYREALQRDPTSYASANNLAVLLAHNGDPAGARELLEAAVRAEPSYSLGWHNLGVIEQGDRSFAGYLRSQGALGRAALLDTALRGADATLQPDRVIYDTGVDVSRPIPPDWTYASTASPPRTHWTITVIALLLVRVGYALFANLASDRLSQQILTAQPGVRPVWWRRSLPAGLAGGLAALILIGRGPWLAPNVTNLVLAVTMVALVATPVAVRWWSTRSAEQYSTPLVMAAGIVGAAVGLAFAPFPSIRGPRLQPIAYWIVPLVLGAIGIVSAVSVLTTGVPLARLAALGCLTLLSSIFVAVPPMDGAQIKGRLVNIAITVLLGGAAVAFAVPLL
jgi:tetratricopeptide (TPR) repeat protein